MSNKFLDDDGVIYLFSKVKERDYQSNFELGYYDTITENDDESYTITRQTGYLTINAEDITSGTSISGGSKKYYYSYTTNKLVNVYSDYSHVIGISSNGFSVLNLDAYWIAANAIALGTNNEVAIGFDSAKTQAEIQALCPITIQYKLATSTTERVEKNHYARYNQKFILDHNKSEAERSATEGKVVHEKEIDSSLSSTSTNPVQNKVINSALDGKANKTDITDMTYVVDSSDNAVSLETYGTGGYYVVPTKTYVDTQLTDKQDKLVSGTNIKTINGSTILGSGDITISGGNGGNVGTDPSFNSVIVEQTGAENTGVKLYANRQGDLYSIKRADTSVNRKILTNSDIDPSKVPTIHGVGELHQHHYEIENQVGDTIYVTCWSTQNTKILLKDITRYAFSNVQVYNSTNGETIQVIKWASSGFRYINDSGNIDSNGYTVTHYYINGEPTTY